MYKNCVKFGHVCKLTIVLISLWGLMHKIYPTSRYQNVSINLLLYSYLTSGYQKCKLALLLGPILQYCPLLLRHQM